MSSKIAFVTGVSRDMGLGYETARQLGTLGYTVIISARDGAKAAVLAENLKKEGLDVSGMTLDISNDASVHAAAVAVEKQYGKLDVLVNNAGGYYDAMGKAMTADMTFIQGAIETNLLGAWRVIQAFVPLLQKSESPRIVNVSSGAASYSDTEFGFVSKRPPAPVYAVTKLALNGLTQKLAKELRASKILINAICPGFVATQPGNEKFGARPVPEGAKGIVWAATLPDGGPTGGFFRDGEPLGW